MHSLYNQVEHTVAAMFHEGYGKPRERGSEAIHSRRTRDCYRRNARRFVRWLMEEKGFHPYSSMEEAAEYIQEYIEHQEAKGLAWATVHTDKAALCKVFKRSMKDHKITISHDPPQKGRVKTDRNRQVEEERPIVAAVCGIIGIRRAELLDLRGRDFVWRKGLPYVRVVKGNGGKKHYQLIVPKYAPLVESFFLRVKPEEKVFRRRDLEEMWVHGRRRELAWEMYGVYSAIIQANHEARELFKKLIYKECQRAEVDPYSKPDMRQLDKPYVAQGAVRESLEKLGRPTEFDRLALMMVAVFHLSHWRVNVVVRNYFR